MGFNDRDYGRAERTPWDRVENPRSVLVILIVINVAVFVGQYLFKYEALLAVAPGSLPRPWLWFQTLTYGFLHNPDNILHLAFNMFLLYVFGKPLEQRLGGPELVKTYLISIIFGGFVAMIVPWLVGLATGTAINLSAITLGASGGVTAVLILFACYYPHQEILLMFVFPVKAWVVACGIVVMNLFGATGLSGGTTAYEVHLAGALFGYLYFRRHWRFDWLDFSGLSELPDRIRSRSRRTRLKLHDPEKKIRAEAEEADRILAKIHDSGEASLTSAERKTLERYSRRQRQKREH